MLGLIENVSRRGVLKGLAAGTGAFVLGGKLLAGSRVLAVPVGSTPFAPNVFACRSTSTAA
jgi:hypothetical protein